MRSKFFLPFLLIIVVNGCISFRQQPRQTPEEAKASFAKGKRYYIEGNYAEAIGEFSLVADNPATPYADDAQLILAKCYYALGDYLRAVKEAKILERRVPDSPLIDSAYLLVVQSYLALGDSLKAAIASVDALKMTADEEKTELFLNEVERLSEKLGREELYQLGKNCENSRAEPIVLLAIAEKEMKRGERGAAKTVLDRLLRIPTDEETTDRARRLLKLVRGSSAIKIGLIAPLSGEYSIYGDALRKGVELALSQYGKLGLVLFDSMGDPIEAVKGIGKLVREHNVTAIIGPVFTKTVIPAAIAADDLDTPLLSPTATDERISGLGDYVFQLDTGLRTQVGELAAYSVRAIGLKKFAIIYPEDAYGKALSTAFSFEVRKLGGEISIIIGYESGKTDFKDEIEALKEHSPDAIFIPAYADDVIMIVTQLRYYEVEIPLLGADGWKSGKLLALAGEYIEGCVFTGFELDADSAQVAEKFTRKYREEYAEDPMKQSAQGFDAARLIIEAVSDGMDSPRTLRNYLDSGPLLVGASGLIYTAKNPSTHVVKLYSIEKGRMEKIE